MMWKSLDFTFKYKWTIKVNEIDYESSYLVKRTLNHSNLNNLDIKNVSQLVETNDVTQK